MNSTDFLNNHILSLEIGTLQGLGNGKMGICIFYYQLYRITKEKKHKEKAENLLNEVIEGINLNNKMDLKEGLLGIAVGMHHLHKEKFIRGNINEILGDIDDVIFKNIAFTGNYSVNILSPDEVLFLLYYLCLRYKDQKSQSGVFIYSELIIKTVNFLDLNLTDKMFKEPIAFNINYFLPIFLYVIGEIISLNIYNYKLFKILEELEMTILGSFPVLHSYRLFLLWGLVGINRFYKKHTYSVHINLLRSKISINTILNSEFSNRQIFLHNGMSLIVALLFQLKKILPDHNFDNDLHLVYEKILESDIWNNTEQKNNYGLLGGLYSPILIINLIRVNK